MNKYIILHKKKTLFISYIHVLPLSLLENRAFIYFFTSDSLIFFSKKVFYLPACFFRMRSVIRYATLAWQFFLSRKIFPMFIHFLQDGVCLDMLH